MCAACHAAEPLVTTPLLVPCTTSGSMHSVHLRDLEPHEVRQLSRLRLTSRDLIEPVPLHRSPLVRALRQAVMWLILLALCAGCSPVWCA